MGQPPPPNIPMHGAVDLSALKTPPSRPAPPSPPPPAAAPPGSALGVGPQHRAAPPAPPTEAATGAFVVEVTEENFGSEVIATSMRVPLVIDFWADWCEPCKQLGPILERLADEYGGRFLLATVDTEANQRLSAEIGIQSLPTVLAVVGQQPVPLFTGALPEAQVRQFLDELLRVAAANGISGTVAPRPTAAGAASAAAGAEESAAPPHAEAHEALVSGDLATAESLYSAALADRPDDADAAAGLARTRLLGRVQGTSPEAALKAAEQAPRDVAAQCLAADVEVASGSPERGFERLIGLVRVLAGEEREAVREHVLGLFSVVGNADPRVASARRSLASALF